jgi:class 3 adenylate cyclase
MQVLFRGPPLKLGMCRDRIREVSPHGTTGRADYWGELVNRTARTMAAAQPGQMLCHEEALVDVRTCSCFVSLCVMW